MSVNPLAFNPELVPYCSLGNNLKACLSCAIYVSLQTSVVGLKLKQGVAPL